MADLIGIVFKPGGFPAFAGDRADRFSNLSVGLTDIWGSAAADLRDGLREVPSPDGKFSLLESFLINRLAGNSPRHWAVDFALNRFARANGIATVAEVADDIGWSMRRFSQIFREQVGLSPKIWCRLRRFHTALRQLHTGNEMRWAELAIDCGYYDQSHFSNEFRAFSGVDVTTYQTRRGQWVNHIAAD
jgi:AraC-like DNA-binding protein